MAFNSSCKRKSQMVAHKTLHDRFPDSIFFPILFHAGPHTILKLKSLTPGTVDRLGWTLLCGGGLSMHFRIFSSTPGLYPLIPVVPTPPIVSGQPNMSPDIAFKEAKLHGPFLLVPFTWNVTPNTWIVWLVPYHYSASLAVLAYSERPSLFILRKAAPISIISVAQRFIQSTKSSKGGYWKNAKCIYKKKCLSGNILIFHVWCHSSAPG